MKCPEITIGNTCNELTFNKHGHFEIRLCSKIIECCKESFDAYNSFGKI